MSDCRFGVSPVNYPDPDPDPGHELNFKLFGPFLYRSYAYIFLSSPTLQSESVNRMGET